jgi:hypothetical protein
MSRINRFTVVCGVLILASAALAQAAGWQTLGQGLVDYRTNPVGVSTKSDVAVKAIKLVVKDAALDVGKVTVTTADGQSFDVALDSYLAAGQESREIEIGSGPKAIKKVEVSFGAGQDGRRLARIQVLGTD